MPAFHSFLSSPLARHPGLLGRKVAARLQLYREDVRVPTPAVSAVAYPARWAPALREWTQQVPLHPPPHPFHRVFGQDFDETTLLEMCREGPRPGETGLKGDIKLAWDYSRGQPLFTNAAAGPTHRDACAAFIRRWLEANADTHGPTWTCAMEVAIRAVNWIFADVLLGGELGRQLGPADWAGWLWRHGYLVWRRLEARLISSNHYLADLLGLFIIGTVFSGDPQAGGWRRFAQGEFPRALLAQTRRDGGLNEASLRYHAFVTEMALLFRLARGSPLPPPAESRLCDMCRLVADFRQETGDVFPIGDDDSGRVLAMDFASPAGRADVLLRLASTLLGQEFRASTDACYPDSGWWVHRAGDFAVALDFGGVGLQGLGAHAHNDDFSVCLDWRGRPVITDPGTFLYTGDLVARNRFRSAFFHNTIVVDGREQRQLSSAPFLLPGLDEPFSATRQGEEAWVFTRPAGPEVYHHREVIVRQQEICIRDRVEGHGRHQVAWRFHLHPEVQASQISHGFVLEVPGKGALLLEMSAVPPALDILHSEYSPTYGWNQSSHACAAQGEYSLPLSAEWKIRPQE